MLKKAFSAAAVLFLITTFAGAQDVGHFDASVGWGGAFGKTSSSSVGNVSVSATSSGLLLATFRVRFNRIHSIEFNYGHTIDSQVYLLPPDNYRVQSTITEYSGAYVLSPFHFQKLEPFVFAGGGALRFYPGNMYIDGFQSPFGAARQTSMAFLYGGGLDYVVWKRLALRLQYRGLVYKEPTFHLAMFFTGARAQMPEATIGIVYRF